MIPDKYSAYLENFSKMITEFKRMCDSLLSATKRVQQRKELQRTNNRLTQPGPHKATFRTREFEKTAKDRILPMSVITRDQTK